MTDRDSFLREVDGAVRQDQYKKLWDNYGVYALAGLLLIVAAVAWTRRPGAVRFVATIVGVALVAFVGLARIASGQHWPTDVLGGLMLGVAWLTICLAVARMVGRRSPVT